MRLFVFLNPRAHAGRSAARGDRLRSLLQAGGHEVDFARSFEAGEGGDVLRELPADRYDGVVSAGGDGTLFEVLNGLMTRPRDERLPVAVIPLGTGNAFARDLDLGPGDMENAVARIGNGRTRPVDVARVRGADGDFHFINMLGVGFVVRAARAAQALKFLGRGAYTLGALAALIHLPRLPLELVLDGERQDPREILFLEVANSRYTGTRFLMAPEARLDDGLLDVVIVHRMARHRALRLLPSLYRGEHVKAPEVEVLRAREVELSTPAGAGALVDGEFLGRTPLVARALPGALEMFC